MTVLGHGVPGWLAVVLGVLAVTGFCAVFVAAAWWRDRPRIMWIRDWWYRRRRGQPAGVSDDCWFGAHEDCDGCECDGCDCSEPPPPLPPERTWEQMTSHQYPGLSPQERSDWSRREKRRWLQAAVAEVQQRQAYEALGLEFPSGLMERVRELTP